MYVTCMYEYVVCVWHMEYALHRVWCMGSHCNTVIQSKSQQAETRFIFTDSGQSVICKKICSDRNDKAICTYIL